LDFNDFGAFICNAENEVGAAQKVFYVTPFELPRITSRLHNITLLTNQSQSAACKASGTPEPLISWHFDGLEIAKGEMLHLNSSNLSGEYKCTATNSEGYEELSFHFNAINEPTMHSDLMHLKQEVSVRESDDLELVCPFENFDMIRWSFNNNSIINFLHDIVGNKIVLQKMNRFSNGEWTCEASNLAGKASFSYNVSTLASPKIHSRWDINNRIEEFLSKETDIEEKKLKTGDRLELNCSANGNPPPKIHWRKASDVIAEGMTFVIESLQFHHEDIYTCIAENEHGSVKKFFKVEIVSAPHIIDDNIQKLHQKSIGDSLVLKCKISGNPEPNIFWFKDK